MSSPLFAIDDILFDTCYCTATTYVGLLLFGVFYALNNYVVYIMPFILFPSSSVVL